MTESASSNQGNDGNGHLPPIPAHWVWSTVREAGEVKLGRQRSPEHHNGPHMRPYLRVANVFEDRIDLSDVLEMNFTPAEYEIYKLQHGDVLLNEGQSLELVGRSAMYRDELPGGCFQNTLIRFRPHRHVDGRFALLIFRHYLHSRRFQRVAKWTVNIAHLGAQRFADIEFPIPPLGEQKRIVDKADELFSDLDAGVAALKRVRASLKRYRAAVLKAAVEGRLTEQWRREHPNVEPAAKLLERILVERRRRWEQDQLARFATNGKTPPTTWKDKYPEPAAPDTTNLPDLPKGWRWATLDQLSNVTGGITKGQRRKPDDALRAVPYLRVANVQQGFLDLLEMKSIQATEQEISELRLLPRDILFTEGGDRDKLGRGWVWNGEIEECIHQNHIFRARLVSAAVQPKLVSWCGNSYGRLWFQKAGKQTVNLASINLTILKRFPIALSPSEEQDEIVQIVEDRLSVLDKSLLLTEECASRSSRLRQSILNRAFEGTLVLRDPADEPAIIPPSGVTAESPKTKAKRPERAIVRARKRKQPAGINYKRGAFAAYAVSILGEQPTFGRTQLEKILYLTQHHFQIDLSLEFKRKAAGPYDEAIHKLESLARKKGWFDTLPREPHGAIYRWRNGGQGRRDAAIAILGDKAEKMAWLLGYFKRMKTEQAELLATVFAAWNDLILDGRPESDDDIVKEVHSWHESKKRFTPERIAVCVKWIRDNGMVPKGIGPHTIAPAQQLAQEGVTQ